MPLICSICPLTCSICYHIWKHGWVGPDAEGGTHCQGCHRTWRGLRESHCVVCHQHFAVDSLAERHVRDHRCMTPAEMDAARSESGRPVFRRDERGVWHYGKTLQLSEDSVGG